MSTVTGQTVWVLVVESKDYSISTCAFSSLKNAEKRLVEWCKEFWDAEGIESSYEGLNDDAIIEAYFEHMANFGGEAYTIDALVIDADAVKEP